MQLSSDRSKESSGAADLYSVTTSSAPATDRVGSPPPFDVVSQVLWELRDLLEFAIYLLTVQRLLAEAGETQWLGFGVRQIDGVVEQIRRTEIVRTADVEAAAAGLGRPPGATLAQLAAAAPDPWSAIFADHRVTLLRQSATLTAAHLSQRSLADFLE